MGLWERMNEGAKTGTDVEDRESEAEEVGAGEGKGVYAEEQSWVT